MLSLDRIRKSYGSHTVISIEEFRLADGIYWIKGGNGTGKTTLFRIIAGQTPFAGEVDYIDINLKKQPLDYRALISYAEAEPQYPGYITGNDLVRYYEQVRGVPTNTSLHLIERFGMTDFMGQTIGGYSSGMLKKLSLICAFIGEIQLFLLDEPLITIDKEAAAVLYSLIREHHEKGSTFIISSHQDIDHAELTVDAAYTINNKDLQRC